MPSIKVIRYSTLAIAGAVVIFMFVSATTYTQLAAAIVLYLPLAYLALQVFPHQKHGSTVVALEIFSKKAQVEVPDVDRRAFLKLIGAAGISYVIFSLLGRRLDILPIGKFAGLENNAKGVTGDQAGPSAASPTDEYKISEIEEGTMTYYGFVNKTGGWYIMKEDTENTTFRYAKGDFGFPSSWTKRAELKYDYYHNIF